MCVGLGSSAESCSPREFCKEGYPAKGIAPVLVWKDQMECTAYCRKQPHVKSDPNLRQPCELGQWLYLNGARRSSLEARQSCKNLLKDEYLAEACRLGVNAEQRRSMKYREDNGTSGDRENGN